MNGKKTAEILEKIYKRVKSISDYDKCLNKVKIVQAGEGKCVAEFTVAEEHRNAGGSLHGGFSATLIDSISTFALMTHGKQVPGVSVDIHISYLKAAFEGDLIVVEANTIKAGRTLAFLDVVIKNKKTGDLLVTGQHTKFIGG